MKKKFQINIKQDLLDDLQKRIAATRWPNEIENDKWQTGTNKAYLQKLCKYWQNNFDWRKQESYLNTFNHYTTVINDNKIHFIYEKGQGKRSMPLLLTHGYPDSFFRFHKLIPLLTKADENDFSFDVIVPSIPGYGFSEIPKEEGMNTKKIAGLWAELITKDWVMKSLQHMVAIGAAASRKNWRCTIAKIYWVFILRMYHLRIQWKN